ncbi:MAG: hypothetical protein WCI89_03865 [bacterium]
MKVLTLRVMPGAEKLDAETLAGVIAGSNAATANINANAGTTVHQWDSSVCKIVGGNTTMVMCLHNMDNLKTGRDHSCAISIPVGEQIAVADGYTLPTDGIAWAINPDGTVSIAEPAAELAEAA